MAKTGVIVVAGGSGVRMGSETPKQFLKIVGKEILVRTVEKFLAALPGCDLVVVLPHGEQARWQALADRYGLECKVCEGGDTRFLSVKRGLACIDKDCDIVAVQDGVRPLLSQKMILDTVAVAREYGSAVPVVEVTDTIRMIDKGGAQTVDRTLLRAVQTPQVFAADMLRKAYRRRYSKSFTDDASVVERDGNAVVFSEGEERNIKITTPFDLIVAEAVIADEEGLVIEGDYVVTK